MVWGLVVWGVSFGLQSGRFDQLVSSLLHIDGGLGVGLLGVPGLGGGVGRGGPI